MARADSPAEALLTDVVAQAVTPPLKAAGSRKDGTNYHRRHGETVQVVNVQVSHGSTWSEKEFFVNAGVAFDAICTLAGVPCSTGRRSTSATTAGPGTGSGHSSLVPRSR